MNHIFCDISVEPISKIGFGAYLLLQDLTKEIQEKDIKIVELVDTSSTKAEIETLLVALRTLLADTKDLIIYTDSQCIEGLLKRRKRLENSNFQGKQGSKLNHEKLYKEFFMLYDKLHFKIVKVKGHGKKEDKNKFEQIFTYVDRASRKALRELIS